MSELNPFYDPDPFEWINRIRAESREQAHEEALIEDAERDYAKAYPETVKRWKNPSHYRASCPDCNDEQMWCAYHQKHESMDAFGKNRKHLPNFCLIAEKEQQRKSRLRAINNKSASSED